jgi:hypothetical protein
LETCSKEEKYFIEKIQLKRNNHQANSLEDQDDNMSEQFSYFDEEPNLNDSFEMVKYPSLQAEKRPSQFEVNIEGILPETTEDLQAKESASDQNPSRTFVSFVPTSIID